MGIRDIVKKIEERPLMYISSRSVMCLKSFIDGWTIGSGDRKEDGDILDGFHDWIQTEFSVSSSQSWAQIILFFSQDEFDALNNFFRLFNEYLSHTK